MEGGSIHPLTAHGNLVETIGELNQIEGALGSMMSRCEAGGMLLSATENSAAAASRIRDADIASESAELVKQQILQQTAAAVLGQANQLPALAFRVFGFAPIEAALPASCLFSLVPCLYSLPALSRPRKEGTLLG